MNPALIWLFFFGSSEAPPAPDAAVDVYVRVPILVRSVRVAPIVTAVIVEAEIEVYV